MGDWRAYYPHDGETADDAVTLRLQSWQRIYDAEDAARIACEHDYSNRDGWERTMGETFPVVIIAPNGAETRWNCQHKATVEHHAEEIEDDADA